MGRAAKAHGAEALRLLAAEARVTYGPVAPNLDGVEVADGTYRLSGDSFLIRTGEGLDCLYRKGQGVIVDRRPDCAGGDEELWVNGSVYAAIASINGYLPVHASAVMHDGKVYAFAGPSGAGKSTLVAALADRGYPLFCDDTLILDIWEDGKISCFPGHKRLKLTPHGLSLTRARPREKVSSTIDKFYAEPSCGAVREVLPLAELIILEIGEATGTHELTGPERLAQLLDDHYTSYLHALACGFDKTDKFAFRAQLARAITMRKLVRSASVDHFAQSVDAAERIIQLSRF